MFDSQICCNEIGSDNDESGVEKINSRLTAKKRLRGTLRELSPSSTAVSNSGLFTSFVLIVDFVCMPEISLQVQREKPNEPIRNSFNVLTCTVIRERSMHDPLMPVTNGNA